MFLSVYAHCASSCRYYSDFEELRRLGRGGFGVVVAAKNRLDGRHYAIKMIKILHSAANYYLRMMREVATLSHLQHPHVVRYFQVLILLLPAPVFI